MSTKTSFKRIALVAASALAIAGFSAVPANAGTSGTGTINWNQMITNPAWIVNPGLVQYTPSTYTIPDYSITTTPGTGTYTIPFSGTINTTTGFSLTTSNPTGTVTTMGGIGGAFTTTGTISTNTFYNSNIK